MPSRALRSARLVLACGLAVLAALSSAGEARADDPPPAAPSGTATPPDAAAPAPLPASSAEPAAAPAPPPAASGDPAASQPARPPPLPPTPDETLPWERTLDIGGDFALVARPATVDATGRPSRVRYQAATGFALHVRWPLFRYLQVEGYYVDVHMPVSIPAGALGLTDRVTSPPVETYVFGARVSPRYSWGRLTTWLTAGAGWGRCEFQRMTATTSSGATYTLRERGGSFVELPFGLGVSWELIPRWLTIDVQGTAAVVIGQRGEAFDHAQTVDAAGHVHDVAPMPLMDASLVQTIGLSLLL